MNILKDFPERQTLLTNEADQSIPEVNGHFHTPYSFSAFENISQVIEMAQKENIKVLGINDFYTTAGYEEFYNLCLENKIFPLFNIEFIGLSTEQQKNNIKVNDP